jgi:SprT protein
MKSNYEMQDEVKIMIELYIEKFVDKMKSVVVDKNIKIYFDLKGTTAGTFSRGSQGQSLHFNMPLMTANYEKYIEQTVGHEVAHYLAYAWKGTEYTRSGQRIGHGDTWKKIMNFLGLNPSRCHSYDTSSIAKSSNKITFEYKCGCNTHQMSSLLHKRMKAGQNRICGTCRQKLVQA